MVTHLVGGNGEDDVMLFHSTCRFLLFMIGLISLYYSFVANYEFHNEH